MRAFGDKFRMGISTREFNDFLLNGNKSFEGKQIGLGSPREEKVLVLETFGNP